MQQALKINSTPDNVLNFFDYFQPESTDQSKSTPNKQKNSEPKYTNQNGHIPVQPIVGDDIQKVKNYLLNRPQRYHNANIDFNLRDYTMFCFNINVGLRIGDFLHLKISDVLKNNKIVDYIAIKEQKTKKYKKPAREIIIIPELKDLLMNYINSMPDYKPDWFLFHGVWPKRTPYKAMCPQNMWKKMKAIEEELDSQVPLGSHSLRKTFARFIFDVLSPTDPMAILVIQEMLGHSSPDVTLRYIGITREKRNNLRLQAGLI